MKTSYFFILLFLGLNSFSKTKYNDTILSKLHGQGCSIIPDVQENNYNIVLLENLQKTDSNNILIYRHLAMQYYFSWAREKDVVLKEALRQKSIEANIKVLNFHQFHLISKSGTIGNLLTLYCFPNDCQNLSKYYSLLNRKEKKTLGKGIAESLKKKL